MNNISMDLVLSEEACQVLDSFVAMLKLQVVFYSADGIILKRGRNFGNSKYCDLMQRDYFGLDLCCKLDREKQLECAKKSQMLCYRCHAGLNELIAPVEFYGKLLGFVMLGQFRTVKEAPDFVTSPEDRKLYTKLPYIKDEELPNLFNMVKMLIDYIVKMELFMLPDNKLLRIKQYLEKHLLENITLKQLARHLCCSESGLTHYLHDQCNTSFKKLLTETRLNYANLAMKKNPALSIKEIANLAGFEDSHYFSRVYTKYYAQSPSDKKRENGIIHKKN